MPARVLALLDAKGVVREMEIKIGKSARLCTACERSFVHEESLCSLVRIVDQQFVREDYCQDCWTVERSQGAFSVWTPRFYDPKIAEQQPPEIFSPLRQAFYECAESEVRTDLAKAYLAAHLLRRQKVFRLVKESDDPEAATRVTLFHDRLGNRLIEVRDPNLTYAELEAGRVVLIERLNELEQAAAPAAESA